MRKRFDAGKSRQGLFGHLGGIGVGLSVVFLAILSVFAYRLGKELVQRIRLPSSTSLFTGTVTKISDDLKLFKISEYDEMEGYAPSTVYYQAGTYVRGKYKGFERIIAIREPLGPGAPPTYVFATKDRKTFVLHDETDATKRFPETDWQNPFAYIDKSKISKIDKLPSEHPKIISLNQSFALFKEELVTQNVPSGKLSPEGYDIYEDELAGDFSSDEKLSVPKTSLSFFGFITPPTEIPESWEEDAKVQAQLREKFIKGTTKVLITDSTGLAYSYSLSRPEEISDYDKKYKAYEKESAIYEKERIRFENKEIPDLPPYPEIPSLPNLRFSKKDIKGGGDVFNTYDIAVPYMCGIDVDFPVIQHISDDQFTPFGTVFGQEIYVLKDSEHPFYKLAYRNKMIMTQEEFEVINEGMEKLSYEEYVSKHPLFFMKDYWGRWIAAGEYDYKLIGGCGKPVLYFYPEKPTDVSVSFVKPMDLSISIPTYQADWYVRAYPDGTLNDLQPNKTDCDSFYGKERGSEYAQKACQLNAYPYLYWAGNREGRAYPLNKNIGWVVRADELFEFLSKTLDTIGFTEREKDDFLSYWIPEIFEKEAPWYHLRFLQTNDMNAFIPMHIDPQPDRYYRFFLDWRALSERPIIPVVPQTLDTIVRRGFTVVEWGGLQK